MEEILFLQIASLDRALTSTAFPEPGFEQ